MGVSISRVGDGLSGDPPHHGVHQEAADDQRREGGLPPRLCTVHRVGADVRDDPVGSMVGTRRGKLTRGIYEEEV